MVSVMFPPVSVILPVYNAEKTVGEAIESVINQTYKRWELIIVDSSSDGSMDVIMEYADDPRIKVYHFDKRLYPGRARRIGVELSNPLHRYIAYIDADDIWYPDHLELEVRYLNRHPLVGLVYTAFRDELNGVYIPELDRPEFGGPGIKSRRSLLPDTSESVFGRERQVWGVPGPPTWMHRRIIIQQVGNWNPYMPYAEDGEFIRRIGRTFWRFGYIDRVTVWCRPQPTGQSERYLDLIREFMTP